MDVELVDVELVDVEVVDVELVLVLVDDVDVELVDDVLVVLVDDVELVEVDELVVDVKPQSQSGSHGSAGTSKQTQAFCSSRVYSVAEQVSTNGLHSRLSMHSVFSTSSTHPAPSSQV